MEDLYLYTTIAIIPLVVLTLIAGFVVQFRFAKYSKENNLSGLTGAQAARKILDEHGLFDVAIVKIEGNLTDNFNPKTNVVSLSPNFPDLIGLNSMSAVICYSRPYRIEFYPRTILIYVQRKK